MPFWVSVKARAFQSAANGHIECVITAFDVTEKILETQLISRLTLMGYEVVGLLSVYSGKVRYFRLKPMHAQFTISDKTFDYAAKMKPDGVGYHIHDKSY